LITTEWRQRPRNTCTHRSTDQSGRRHCARHPSPTYATTHSRYRWGQKAKLAWSCNLLARLRVARKWFKVASGISLYGASPRHRSCLYTLYSLWWWCC